MGRYSQRLAAPFADFAGVCTGMRALDVGAGTGALTAELVARLGSDVAAVEPSTDFVETLRGRFPGIEVRQASAEALPWDDGCFDALASAGPNTRWMRAATERSADLMARGRDVASEVLGRPRGAFTLRARAMCVRGLA